MLVLVVLCQGCTQEFQSVVGENLTQEELETMMKEADLDGDQEVNFQGAFHVDIWTGLGDQL